MKRFLSLVLALLMLLPLIGCNSEKTDGEGTGNGNMPENLLTLTEDYMLICDGKLSDDDRATVFLQCSWV